MKKLLKVSPTSAPWAWLGLILFVISGECPAQSENEYEISRIKQYRAKIILTNGQKIKGRLIYATNYSILLDEIVYKKSRGVHPGQDIILLNNEVHYKDIESVRIRSLGSTLGGIAIGTTAGVVMGGVTGFVECEDCDWSEAGDAGLGLGLAGGLLGGVVGGVLASQFKIAGQYSSFQDFLHKLTKKGVPVGDFSAIVHNSITE